MLLARERDRRGKYQLGLYSLDIAVADLSPAAVNEVAVGQPGSHVDYLSHNSSRMAAPIV